MAGLELLNRMCSDPKRVLCAVCVLTPSQYNEDGLAAYKHYSTGYIEKSLNKGFNNY
jgi:hypothetical protein